MLDDLFAAWKKDSCGEDQTRLEGLVKQAFNAAGQDEACSTHHPLKAWEAAMGLV